MKLIKDEFLSICLKNKKAYYLKKFNYKDLKDIDIKNIFITFKTKNIFEKNFFVRKKFVYIDQNLEFRGIIKKEKKLISNLKLSVSKKNDFKDIFAISKKNLNHSRFLLDKRITKKQQHNIKKNWILNYYKKKRGTHLIISKIQNETIGFGLFNLNKKNLFIDLICVKKKYQKKNVAKEILNYMFNFSKLSKFYIFVGTNSSNKSAVKFYKKLGLKLVNRKYILHYIN